MCLAVPAEIVEIEDEMAVVDAGGVKRKVSLLLLEDYQLGDYVIVHAGFAIHKVDPREAEESLKILEELREKMPAEVWEELKES